MSSPAQRHYQRVTAATEAAAVAAMDGVMADATQYELQLVNLATHKRRLKKIQSIERKIEVKRELVGEYDAYIKGVIESDAGVQDDVLTTLMVWRIDTGDISGALEIAEYALDHGLKTPEQYNRDTATLVAEEIAEIALKDPAAVSLDDLDAVELLTSGHDMPDEVRAKLHKALGLRLVAAGRKSDGLSAFNRALQLHDRVGVKKDIERLERELRKEQQPEN